MPAITTFRTFCITAACALAFVVPAPAHAVSANGPYYAMPAWDQTLPANIRFIVLTNMNSEAVLDRETGLVWEKTPSTTTFNPITAREHCINLVKGGRMGWRLAEIQELSSLVDPTVSPPGPTLPAGHPFALNAAPIYLSATTTSSGLVWALFFTVGLADPLDASTVAWCVRGGRGLEIQ